MDRQINMSSMYWYNMFSGSRGASGMSGEIVTMNKTSKSSNDYSLALQPLLKSETLTWFDENLMGLVKYFFFFFFFLIFLFLLFYFRLVLRI